MMEHIAFLGGDGYLGGMLKILDTPQIRALDAYTIRQTPIASIDLMERACEAFVAWFIEHYDPTTNVGVVCGTGNNGGDGLGIARILMEASYAVNVWVVRGPAPETADFKTNLGRLKGKIPVHDFPEGANETIFKGCDVLVDGIFGSGLSRPAEGIYAQAIRAINLSSATRIAIDIPSGLFADRHSAGEIIKADYTLTFQLPKLAFMFPENHAFVGAWELADIGLSRAFIKESKTPYHYLDRRGVRKLHRKRSTFDHKGNYGRALLIAGGYGKMGACILAARAAMRAGVGLLTVHVPKQGYPIIQSAVPESMAMVDDHEKQFTTPPDLDGFDVIGIGPGIGQAAETREAFGKVLSSGKPMVIDADALNILGAHHEMLQLVPPGSILTPHPKEFERLAGSWRDDFERLEKQIKLAGDMQCVIVLKGAHTSIASPDGGTYFNSTGNPGMGTGGSGDVLTGMLTGLLAQKYSSRDAAILGVYLHGLSGDHAAHDKGMDSLIASDLVDYLPSAYRDL